MGRPAGTPKTGGRKKGTPNKVSKALRESILEAAEQAHEEGTVGYLKQQAKDNPTAFLSLLGKVLPSTIAGDPESPLETVTTFRLASLE